MTDPETFYQQTYQTLLILRQREASYERSQAPAALRDQIGNYEKAIFLTRQRLDSLISEGDWRKAIQRLTLTGLPAEPAGAPPIDDPQPVNVTGPDTAVDEYNLHNIRQLLTKGFSDTELRSFCFDQPEFQEVYDQLAETSGKEEIVSLIIEHADQELLFEPLLAWAKIHNPSRYKQHQPYTIG